MTFLGAIVLNGWWDVRQLQVGSCRNRETMASRSCLPSYAGTIRTDRLCVSQAFLVSILRGCIVGVGVGVDSLRQLAASAPPPQPPKKHLGEHSPDAPLSLRHSLNDTDVAIAKST